MVLWPALVVFAVFAVVVSLSLHLLFSRERDGTESHDTVWSVRYGDIFGTSPKYYRSLLCYRVAAFTYLAGLTVWDASRHGAFTFTWFTSWNFVLLTAYFGLGAALSLRGVVAVHRSKQQLKQQRYGLVDNEAEGVAEDEPMLQQVASSSDDTNGNGENDNPKSGGAVEEDPPSSSPNSLDIEAGVGDSPADVVYTFDRFTPIWWDGYAFLVLQQVCMTMVLFVDIVTWCVLYPKARAEGHGYVFINYLSLNQHAANAVFMLVEVVATDLPFLSHHFAYVLLWSCSYTVFQWAYHASGGSWQYFFMDLYTPAAPLWYLALLFLNLVCFSSALGLNRFTLCIRQKVTDWT
eukprot:jgi/Chlat1/5158/Chrsp33S05148